MGKSILTDLRSSCGLSAAQIVEAVRRDHPKFDKPLLSKCEHAEDYGIAPLPSTVKAARSLAPDWQPTSRTDQHKHRFTIRCRMDEELHKALTERVHRDGYATVQDWIMERVQDYLKGGDHDAADPG